MSQMLRNVIMCRVKSMAYLSNNNLTGQKESLKLTLKEIKGRN
jgi:hypothetical protein